MISCGKILKRSTSDILRYSYLWKNGKLKDENEALRQHRRISISHARQNRTLGAPSLGKMRIGDKSEVEDDETSIYAQPLAGTGSTMVCVTCLTKISQFWWRCPRTVPGIAMCESCGYVELSSLRLLLTNAACKVKLPEVRSYIIRQI